MNSWTKYSSKEYDPKKEMHLFNMLVRLFRKQILMKTRAGIPRARAMKQ
jgi:hypothetical protein